MSEQDPAVEMAIERPDGTRVAPGDRIGIWSPNRFEWVITQLASARVGAILVNINPAYRSHELQYVLEQAGIEGALDDAGVNLPGLGGLEVAGFAAFGRYVAEVVGDSGEDTALDAASRTLTRVFIDREVARIKDAIRKSYGGRGEDVVRRNCEAVDRSLEGLVEVVATVEGETEKRLLTEFRLPGD